MSFQPQIYFHLSIHHTLRDRISIETIFLRSIKVSAILTQFVIHSFKKYLLDLNLELNSLLCPRVKRVNKIMQSLQLMGKSSEE